MKTVFVTLVCVTASVAALAQSNARFNSVSLGPSTSQPTTATGMIRMPNGGVVITTKTSGNCYKLQSWDVDGGTATDMLTVCAANTPTMDLTSNVTVGGTSLVTIADPGFHAGIVFDNTDNQFKAAALGGQLEYHQSSTTFWTYEPVNNQTGTSYTYVNGDRGKLVTHSNGSAIAGTLPQAGASSSFISGWYMDVQNRGAGTLTITPTTSTIDGAASLALTTNQGARIVSDGTNYFTKR